LRRERSTINEGVDMLDTRDLYLATAVVVFGAIGTYLLLPHGHRAAKPARVHAVGGGLMALAILLFALFWAPPAPFLSSLFFYGFSLAAVAGAVLTVTSRNPIYSALWFASVVLSTSGLFLLAGAQFLAVGTIIVYAGAIIVTFLFVTMLAQMQGRALYDRTSRMPMRATLTSFLLFWALLYSLFLIKIPAGAAADPVNDPRLLRTSFVPRVELAKQESVAEVEKRARFRPTSQLRDSHGRPKPHVAALGETLYTDHLITVELAGALLFVALVGAVAIASPRAPVRPAARVIDSKGTTAP
jgi:NADH-quinone oxidoreductase subunit J